MPSLHRSAVLVLLATLVEMARCCQFDDYLQSQGRYDRRWMYRIRNQGERGANTDMYTVTFDVNVMEVQAIVNVLNPPDPIRPYRRQCLDSSNQGYITSHEYSDEMGLTKVRYGCVKFHRYAPHVVIMIQGMLMDDYNTHLCNGSLTIDWWPLISYSSENVLTSIGYPESIIGGYHFLLEDRDGAEICRSNDVVPSRLEVSCMPDQSMNFSFSDNCESSDLKMKGDVAVNVLAEWKTSNFRFLVLKKIKSLNLWCLRIPLPVDNQLNSFRAQLFLDVVCDQRRVIPDKINYVEFKFERIVYSSLCQDVSTQCSNSTDVCNLANFNDRMLCLDSCDGCRLNFTNPTQSCGFDNSIPGAWVRASRQSTSDVVITTSNLYLSENDDPYQCTVAEVRNQGRYPLVLVNSNGCFPKFTCIEFTTESAGYVRYRLGWVAYWPRDLWSLDGICNDDNFAGHFDEESNTYRKPIEYNLVYNQRSPDFNNRTVPCEIGNANSSTLSFERLPTPQKHRCHGALAVSCSDQNSIDVLQSDCMDWPLSEDKYHCMASMVLNDNRRMLVTITDQLQQDDVPSFQCWMFSANLRNLYVLPWADCTQLMFDQITNRDLYTEDRHTFVVDATNMETSTCDKATTPQPEPVVITLLIQDDQTTYVYPEFVGTSSSNRQELSVMILSVMMVEVFITLNTGS